MRTHTEGDFNTISSAEVIESEMPLRVEQTSNSYRESWPPRAISRRMWHDAVIFVSLQPMQIFLYFSDKNIIIRPMGWLVPIRAEGIAFWVFRDGNRVENANPR